MALQGARASAETARTCTTSRLEPGTAGQHAAKLMDFLLWVFWACGWAGDLAKCCGVSTRLWGTSNGATVAFETRGGETPPRVTDETAATRREETARSAKTYNRILNEIDGEAADRMWERRRIGWVGFWTGTRTVGNMTCHEGLPKAA